MESKKTNKKDGVNIIRITKEVKEQIAKDHENIKDKLHILEVAKDEDQNELLEVVVKAPDRNVVSNIMKFMDQAPKKAMEIAVNHCVLTSKEEVKGNDRLFYAVFNGISELIPMSQAKVKKF